VILYSVQCYALHWTDNKLQNEKTGHVNNKNLENRKHDQKHETSRLKHADTEENVITVVELVGQLRQEGQKQTHRLTRQISKRMHLTQRSIVQIIHLSFLFEVFFVYQHACCLLLLAFHTFIFHKVV